MSAVERILESFQVGGPLSPGAQANLEAVRLRGEDKLVRIMKHQIPALTEDHCTPTPQKHARLVELIDRAAAVIEPNTPCHKGCSHCCHQAVGISAEETRRIAAYLGKPMPKMQTIHGYGVDPATAVCEKGERNIEKYKFVPCTFLGPEGECQIYEVRPIACRTFQSMEASAEACNWRINTKPVSLFNWQIVQFCHVIIDGVAHDGVFEDIRDMFPTGVK